MTDKPGRKYWYLLVCVLLILATLAVYWPVHKYDFVHYDDDDYVTDNQNVQRGLTWQSIKWAFTTSHASNWHPLTWLSHIIDCQLFGANAGYHHLVNLLFHIANTLLLFIVFNRMTKALWPSAFVAALFALHPLHVESVAWIAERKDVLSTLFWLGTMLAYARYAERPSPLRYVATLFLFALGLLSKPMLVTLPFVLILLDYWLLNRLNSKFSILNSAIEKIPFFVFSILSSIITFIVQHKGGAVTADIDLRARVSNALVSYVAYIGKMFVPVRLAVLYPHPANGIPLAKALVCALVLMLLTVFFLYFARRYKYLAVGWLWYLGTLVPVIGIVQVGVQALADRYTYIPLTGLFVIIAFAANDLCAKLPGAKPALAYIAILVLAAATVATANQLKYWKDSFALFDHTLAVTQNNYVMHNNYGNILTDLDKPAEAARHFEQTLRFIPNDPAVHNNYGNALRKLGRIDEAIEHYNIALKLKPDFLLVHYNFGLALVDKGDYNQAIEHYKIYLGPGIDASSPHLDIATLLAQQGKTDDAIKQYQEALKYKPDMVEAISNLGYAFAQKQQFQQAVEYYYKALQIDPNDVITHGRLALALASLGTIDEAIDQCRIVLKTRPDDVEMHTNLGILLQKQGKLDEAIESYRKALQIDTGFQKARDRLNAALAQKQKNQ
jgi:tetratricopeptide (TPR) repeat protein